MIIANNKPADCLNRKRSSQARRIRDVFLVVVASRKLVIRAHAQVRVRAHCDLLSAPKSERDLGVENDSMIGKEFIAQAIIQSEAVEIIPGAQHHVMELGQKITEACFAIEAPEIECRVFAVVEDLFTRAQVSVQIPGDLRIVKER